MNDTREYIIDKAFELFLIKSYEAVSISDISNAIGFTKGALYHHFVNKEELFKAVLDKYLIFKGIEEVSENVTLEDYNELLINNVRTTMTNLFGRSPQYVPINYLTLIADGFRHYPGFAAEKERLFNSEINIAKQVLDNSVKRGEIRSDIDTSTIAMIYFSNAIGLAGNLLQNSSVEKSIELLKSQLDAILKLLKI